MRTTWKSLSELAHDAAEFPAGADVPDPDLNRREFLELAGAGLALAGLSGCSVSEPDDVIVPYREQPRDVHSRLRRGSLKRRSPIQDRWGWE